MLLLRQLGGKDATSMSHTVTNQSNTIKYYQSSNTARADFHLANAVSSLETLTTVVGNANVIKANVVF